MTTTTIAPPTLIDPAPDPRAPDPRDAPSLPARLLAEAASGPNINAYRVGLGVLGLAAVGALPALAAHFVDGAVPELAGSAAAWFGIRALWLPVVAILTLCLPLPGLSIVLGVVNQAIPFARVAHALIRAFYRAGLLSLGLTPTLLLFALTGASPRVIEVGAGLFYLGCLGLAVAGLLGEFVRALPQRSLKAQAVLLGWAGFVAVFGVHLLERFWVNP